jgi:hypothetical protein
MNGGHTREASLDHIQRFSGLAEFMNVIHDGMQFISASCLSESWLFPGRSAAPIGSVATKIGAAATNRLLNVADGGAV